MRLYELGPVANDGHWGRSSDKWSIAVLHAVYWEKLHVDACATRRNMRNSGVLRVRRHGGLGTAVESPRAIQVDIPIVSLEARSEFGAVGTARSKIPLRLRHCVN